jgi:anti-sigma factor RsiW
MDPHEPESLSLYLDGELDPAGRARVEEHLASCAACRATLEAFSKVRELLREPGPAAPPDELAQRRALREILRSRAPEPVWRRPVVLPAPGFAALLAALAVAFGTVVFDRLPSGRKLLNAQEESPEARVAPGLAPSGSSSDPWDPASFDRGGRMEIFVASHPLAGGR